MSKNFLIISDPLIKGSKNFDFYLEIARELARRGNKIYIIPSTLANEFYEIEKLQHNVVSLEITIFTIPYLAEKFGIEVGVDDRKKISRFYEGTLKPFYFTEYIYTLGKQGINNFYMASNDCEKRDLHYKTIQHFLVMERFFYDYKIDFVLQFMGGEILRKVCYFIGKKLGIPNIYLSFTPIPNHFILTTNEYSQWDELNLIEYNKLSYKEINHAKNFLNDFKKNKKMLLSCKPINGLIDTIKNRYSKNTSDRFLAKCRNFLGAIKWTIEDEFRLKKYKKYYKQPNYDEDFIFFPLHYHCESRMTVRDPHVWRQEYLAEYIARCLPYGYNLYVKVHPGHQLSFPLEGMELMSKVSNIKLIFPEINSHELIEKSKAIAVMNSTTGFEAILYGKPVICFGKAFYHNLDLTYDVKDLRELPQLLYRAINSSMDEKRIIEYLSAVLRASREGEVYNKQKGAYPENIKKIVDGIMDFVKSREMNYE